MFDVAFGSTLRSHFTQVDLLAENLDLRTNTNHPTRPMKAAQIRNQVTCSAWIWSETPGDWHERWSLKSEISERATQQIWARRGELERRLWTQTSAVTMIWFVLENKCSSAPTDLGERIWQRSSRSISSSYSFISEESVSLLGSESIMWHNGQNDGVCLNNDYTACSSVTYVPSTRNMFDIVLGAQARSHVTVVHFFGDYLNL